MLLGPKAPLPHQQRLGMARQVLPSLRVPRRPRKYGYSGRSFAAGMTFIHGDLKTAGPANPAMLPPAPMNGLAAFAKNPELNARIAPIAASSKSPMKPTVGICRVEMNWGGIL